MASIFKWIEDRAYDAFYKPQQDALQRTQQAANAQAQANQQFKAGQINRQQYSQQLGGAANVANQQVKRATAPIPIKGIGDFAADMNRTKFTLGNQFVRSLPGAAQNFVNPDKSPFAKGAVTTAQGVARAPEQLIRSVAGLPFKAQDQDLLTSNKVAGIPGSEGLAKKLYGNGPIQTYQKSAQDAQQAVQQSKNPIIRGLAPAAPLLAPLLAAGDATALGGVTSGVTAAAKQGVKQAVKATNEPGLRTAEKAAGIPRTNVLNDNEAFTLSDFADISMGRANVPANLRNQITAQARLAADNAGIDIVKGSRADIDRRIASYLEARDTFRNARQSVSQGGYVGVPGGQQKLPGIDPMQRVFDQNPMNQNPIANPQQAPLPTINIKPTSTVDKVFRSTRSVIERQGKPGQELAGMLRSARDTEELYQADLIKQMPTVMKVKEKDFDNFVDATQGLAEPKNPQIAQAVKEWQGTHPQIRDRAIKAGLDVGDLGEKYYPHMVDYDAIYKNRSTFNEAINHLVQTGQAKDQADAIKLLGYARDSSRNRTFGNLEASRLVDLPMYDKTPNSLRSYLQGSSRRTVQAETFGKGDEKALDLISKAGQEGYDTEAAKNAYDVAVGAKKYNPSTQKFSGNVRRYITTTRLGLGALTNVSQSVNTGIVTGHLRTLGAAVKQLDPKNREFVADTGTISDALLNDIRSQKRGYSSAAEDNFTTSAVGKVIDKITAPGFGAVEKFNRSVAATAGRDYALRLAQKGDEKTLRGLGVTGEIKNGTLTKNQQIQAARKVVEKTQFKVDPQDLPGWADSPGGKLVAQFRTFSYSQAKFVSNEILKPAAKGNLLPLARMMAALPLGYALYETRRQIDGRPEEENKLKEGLAAFGKIGGAGLALDLFMGMNPVGTNYLPMDRRVSMAVGTFGGPAVGQATSAIAGVSEAVQRKKVPEDEDKLEGKVVAGKTDENYTDLTSLTRFGLQQIPVVGTATANRVLPYKKQTDAENGTKTAEEPSPDLLAWFNGKSPNPKKDAAKELLDKNKDRSKALKKSLSDEDYNIMQLTKADRQQLIDSKAYSAEKIRGLEGYYSDKRKELGYETAEKADTYKQKYDKAVKEFDTEGKKWSPVQRQRKENELKTLKVQKDFDNDTVSLYGMSKSDLADFVGKDENGKKYVEQVLKYGDALVDAGLASTNKFRDKYGKISIYNTKKAAKGKGSKGGKGRKKGSSVGLPKLGRVRQSTIRTPKIATPSFKTPNVKKPTSNGALAKLLSTRIKTA